MLIIPNAVFCVRQEVSDKSDKISKLEQEKASLIRELFESRSKHKTNYDDTTFMWGLAVSLVWVWQAHHQKASVIWCQFKSHFRYAGTRIGNVSGLTLNVMSSTSKGQHYSVSILIALQLCWNSDWIGSVTGLTLSVTNSTPKGQHYSVSVLIALQLCWNSYRIGSVSGLSVTSSTPKGQHH